MRCLYAEDMKFRLSGKYAHEQKNPHINLLNKLCFMTSYKTYNVSLILQCVP